MESSIDISLLILSFVKASSGFEQVSRRWCDPTRQTFDYVSLNEKDAVASEGVWREAISISWNSSLSIRWR